MNIFLLSYSGKRNIINSIMISLYLYSFIYQQVLPICNKLSDCFIGTYCSSYNLCYDCSYIEPGTCDALNDNCCTHLFLSQCSTNPYQCTIPNNSKTNKRNGLFMFNLIFFISSISYLSIGSYRNKYLKQKEGWYIIPNYESWKSLLGLVKEGFQFSYHKLKRDNYELLE